MVRFTIWSSHSPQTLLMLYHRMDGMISIAGFVIGKAKSSAVNSVLGFIMLSVWNWQRNQRGIGFAQNVRLVWYKEWISFLFVRYKQRYLAFWNVSCLFLYCLLGKVPEKFLQKRRHSLLCHHFFCVCTCMVFAFLPQVFNFLCFHL